MTRLLSALVILLVAVSAYGYLTAKMRLTTIDESKEFLVVVTDSRADASYRYLTVTGCSADHTDNGIECNLGWTGRSDREWIFDRVTGEPLRQMTVPMRDAPRGPILRFDAVVLNREGRAVSSASMIAMRKR